MPPDTRVLGGPQRQDVDLYTINESDGGPTYAAVASRSYHPGEVTALFLDGSVHFAKDTINGLTWRALGTIAGGEVVSSASY
jgi:prepilin-type processing-associated H-X9-DG protein